MISINNKGLFQGHPFLANQMFLFTLTANYIQKIYNQKLKHKQIKIK